MDTHTTHALYEPDAPFAVEVTLDVQMYYEPAEPGNGLVGGFSADDYELTEMSFWWFGKSGESVIWLSKNEADIKMALAVIQWFQPNHRTAIDKVIDETFEESNADYEPPRD